MIPAISSILGSPIFDIPIFDIDTQRESPLPNGPRDVGAGWPETVNRNASPTTIDKYCESYTQCAEGVEADLCSLPGVDHAPYNNALGFNIAATAWKMFQRQPMR
jgi:hypothetical protein